jgi:HD-like signal output (HDOD) protein
VFKVLNKKTETTQQTLKLEGFSERETLAFFQAGKIRRLEDKEPVFKKGDAADLVTLIVEGSLAIIFETSNGASIQALVNSGRWVGNPDIARNVEYRFSVFSQGPSRLLEVDRFSFNLLSPEIQMKVYRKLIETSETLIDHMVVRSAMNALKVSSLVSNTQTSLIRGREEYKGSAMIQEMIRTFPRLPIQINKLTSMLLDEGASVTEIVGFAKMDPSIVSVVLKTVNSGFYNFQRKISDFHHAFVLLGFNQVYQILMDNFLQGVMPKHFNLRNLNLHSAIVSQVAFDIAQLSKKGTPVMMSTLGILHDLGKCVVLISKDKRPEIELALSMLDDSMIGSLLLDVWNTPPVICRSVEYQAYPQFCPPEMVPEDCRECVAILFIAHLCFDYLSGKKQGESHHAFSSEYMNILNLDKYSIQELVNQHILPSLIRKVDVFPDYVRDFITENQPAFCASTR